MKDKLSSKKREEGNENLKSTAKEIEKHELTNQLMLEFKTKLLIQMDMTVHSFLQKIFLMTVTTRTE